MWDLAIFVTLVVIGYVVGRILEKRHYRSIRAREQELRDIMVFASRFPPTLEPLRQDLVAGSVVISTDYFKLVVAGLQSIVGGRLKTYETLLDRARRGRVGAALLALALASSAGAAMKISWTPCGQATAVVLGSPD